MSPFIWPANCSVCGGDGVGTSATNYAAWTGGFISHRNPAVCAAVIEDRRRRWLRDHRFRVYCDGREFGKDYTRDKAREVARSFASDHPMFAYTVRDDRGRFA